ncbi:MAG: LuxR C-terminal-related transcriptional regulator [Chloroflexota bacterium]
MDRPHLPAKLNGGLPCKMVLVSAPAGYGKTTLTTAWLDQLKQDGASICWVALDEDDSDPQQFFRYLAAAIESLPGVQSTLSHILQSNRPQSAKGLIQRFISDVSTVSSDFYLVLDDYHRLDSAEIDMAIAALLDYMPPQMTLVMTSRSDPGFPISRLRARREIIEIRAGDLRFTTGEAAQFFEQTMGLTLGSDQIEALEERTEGWVAGLQMAALSMQNRADVDAFVSSFTGSHRFILDYLVEEVLNQQSVEVQDFLLKTAVLTRLSADLCDELLQSPTASQQILEQLEADNIFLIPLDNERRWYRYHHLFSDLLRTRLAQAQPELVPELHQRASNWYGANGRSADAIRHALTAKDFELAAAHVELAWGKMDRSFQEATWLSWVQGLPEKLIRQRPVLCAGYAWALLDTGQFEQIEKVESFLDQAEQWLETPSADMIVVDQKEFNSLPAKIAAARAYIAYAAGDLPATMRYAQLTLDLLPEDDHFYRGIPAVTLGMAQLANGDLKYAFKSFSDAVTSFELANNPLFALNGRMVMADIKVTQGHLHEATHIHKESLRQFEEQKVPLFRTGESLHRAIGAIFYEQGDLEAARQHLEKSQAFSKKAGIEDPSSMFFVAQAKLKRAEGDFDGALELLDKAQAAYSRGRMPEVAPIAALKSRILISKGDLAQAERWASEQALVADDELSYLREYDHLTFARLLIARFRQDGDFSDLSDVEALLLRLLSAAENGDRMGSVIEILVLKALAYALHGTDSTWEAPLRRALTLAQPQGYVHLFVNEGEPILQLLKQVALENPNQKAYRDKLLAAFGVQSNKNGKSQPLVDPLSERELEILSLIAAGLKNKEIAAELIISLNTVLYHVKNIYGKLGVNKRTLAIARARELGLI